jgi:hypothetical protein
MVKFLLVVISFVAGQISYMMIHDCQFEGKQEVALLKKQAQEKDSLLYFWFNDYAFHIRVISGVEKDTSVMKYQIWNHQCIAKRKKK